MLIDLLMSVLGVLLLGSAMMMLSLARRLGRPVPTLRSLQIDLRGWPRRWLFLLVWFTVVKGIGLLERAWRGVPIWPQWRRELVLILIVSGIAALFTRSSPPEKKAAPTAAADERSQ